MPLGPRDVTADQVGGARRDAAVVVNLSGAEQVHVEDAAAVGLAIPVAVAA
jgi:hypothetical protein